MKKVKKDLLAIKDLSKEEIKEILEVAHYLKEKGAKKERWYHPLKGKTLGMLFQYPSTRTRLSFSVAMYELGGGAFYLNAEDLQLGRGESIADTARTFSRYLHAVVIRGEHKFIEDFAKNASISVINGLSELNHPCQVLTDLFTLEEKRGSLKDLKVAYIGDGNNICHSWINLAAKMEFCLNVCTPRGYEPKKEIIQTIAGDMLRTNAEIEIIYAPQEAVKNADVLYTDTWFSMGQEKKEKKLRDFRPYQVNTGLLKKAKRNCYIMHCLPAHRGQEITSEVLDGKNSLVWEQVENRLHLQKAILVIYMGRRK